MHRSLLSVGQRGLAAFSGLQRVFLWLTLFYRITQTPSTNQLLASRFNHETTHPSFVVSSQLRLRRVCHSTGTEDCVTHIAWAIRLRCRSMIARMWCEIRLCVWVVRYGLMRTSS